MKIKCSLYFIEYNTKRGSSSIVSKHVVSKHVQVVNWLHGVESLR